MLTIAGGSNVFGQALTCGNGANSTGTIQMTGGYLQIRGGGSSGALVLGGTAGANNSGTFAQSGGLSVLGVTTQTNYIGNVVGNTATYTLSGGTNQINGSLMLGCVSGSTGNVCVSGGQLTDSYYLFDGCNGMGSMTVSNGNWSTLATFVGYNTGGLGTLSILGGTGTVSGATMVGCAAGATGNVFMSGGYLVTPSVSLCPNGVAAMANVLVSSGAVLEANALASPVPTGSGGFSDLNGGVWQFTTGTPTISNNNNNIIVSNATIAFRAIATADVHGNWTGSQLTNVLWQGTNTFCLNAASNTTTINQDYTFAGGLGASNYVCLKLVNGAVYRNGTVTIGNGGTLAVQGGPCTIASNLTLNSQSTLSMTVGGGSDCLIVTNGTADLGGATLQLAFNTCPTNLYPLTILRAGTLMNSFSVSRLSVSYGGTNYTTYINKSGNSVVLNSKITPPPGTAIVFW